MNKINVRELKNKSVSCFFLIMFLILAFDINFRFVRVKAFSGSGAGTSGNPYVITTIEQLQEMNQDLNAWYVLGNDIDASETAGWNGGLGFDPLGNSTSLFTGHFDGQGYVIHDLYINRSSQYGVGLFGIVDYVAEIRNVGLAGINISGNYYVGGFAGVTAGLITNCSSAGSVNAIENVGGFTGYNFGSITDCYSTGNVDASENVGGFTGYNFGTITDCYSTGSVNAIDSHAGGFVGVNEGSITDCYSAGSVNASGYAGGFVGINYASGEKVIIPGSIARCYSTGSVNGSYYRAGGFAGYNIGLITDCYSTGNVDGSEYVGGFVGYNSGGPPHLGGEITNCYSTGSVDASGYAGGFAGSNYLGPFTSCYWDNETSGMTTSDGGEGKTTTLMQQQATFTSWDFTDIWCIGEDATYPHLRGMPEQVIDSATGSGNTFFDVDDVYVLTDLISVAEGDLPQEAQDSMPALAFPHGFFSFKVLGLADGASVTVTIEFPDVVPAGVEYWRWGPEPSNLTDHWYQIPIDAIDGNTINITLTDNGLGDDVLNGEDGMIIDQGGPGYAPKPVGDANGPYVANEGTAVIFNASDSTDPIGLSLEFRWDFDNDDVWDTVWSSSPTASYTWYDDWVGTAKVQVSNGILSDNATASMTINNVAPTASIDSVIAPDPAFPGDTISFTGSATDPGTLDTLTFEWDFGDSTTASGESVNHVYTDPGTYTISLNVTDDDGGSGIDTYPLTITQRATVEIDPDTLNLKSKGRWITCYIELSAGYDGEDIVISTVTLSYGGDENTAEWGDVQDGMLMVKFNRSEVANILSPSDMVDLIIRGQLTDGTTFQGNDTIRVISKEKKSFLGLMFTFK